MSKEENSLPGQRLLLVQDEEFDEEWLEAEGPVTRQEAERLLGRIDGLTESSDEEDLAAGLMRRLLSDGYAG